MPKILFFILALSLVLTTGSVHAADGGDKAEAEDDSKDIQRGIELYNMPFPIAEDGRLINYLFVSVRIRIKREYDHWALRENTHIIRDNILAHVHETSYSVSGKPMKLDESRTTEMIRKIVNEFKKADAVTQIDYISIDTLKLF